MVVGTTMSISTQASGNYIAHHQSIGSSSTGGSDDNLWTHEDLYHEEDFCNAEFFPTRFARRDILTKMGIAHNVDELITDMGLVNLAIMDYKTYPQPCKHLLSTITHVYDEEGNMFIQFLYGETKYAITMRIFCHIYGFPRMEYEEASEFNQGSNVWQNVALHEEFDEANARLSKVANPTVRYVLGLLRNRIFAEEIVTTTTKMALMMLHHAIKGVM